MREQISLRRIESVRPMNVILAVGEVLLHRHNAAPLVIGGPRRGQRSGQNESGDSCLSKCLPEIASVAGHVRFLLSHQGKVRPLRSMKRRPARPRLRSTVSTTSGVLSSIESVAAEVPMSVRTQPGAISKGARGSPAWRAEKHFISMLRVALLEL